MPFIYGICCTTFCAASPLYALAWSVDGGQLAAATGSGAIVLFDYVRGIATRRLQLHSQQILKARERYCDGLSAWPREVNGSMTMWGEDKAVSWEEGQQLLYMVTYVLRTPSIFCLICHGACPSHPGRLAPVKPWTFGIQQPGWHYCCGAHRRHCR